jgi:hypothetical protein
MQITEILSKIETREEMGSSESIGTIHSLFLDHDVIVVKKSRTGATRASILVKKDGQVKNIICSEAISPAIRDGRITREHLVGFPLFYNEEQNQLYVGAPSAGWVAVRDIEVEDFDMSDFSF